MNVYTKCPIFENENYLIKFINASICYIASFYDKILIINGLYL